MIVIAKNIEAEKVYQQACEDKISACMQLLEHVVKIGVECSEELFKKPLEVIFKHVQNNQQKDFPPYVTTEKILELMDISVNTITSLSSRINSIDADVDYTTLTPIGRDFNVYANGKDAARRYKVANDLKEAIYNAQTKLDMEFYLGDLIRSFKGVYFSKDMRTIEINPLWINNELR